MQSNYLIWTLIFHQNSEISANWVFCQLSKSLLDNSLTDPTCGQSNSRLLNLLTSQLVDSDFLVMERLNEH